MINGVVTVLVTPLTKNLEICTASLKTLIDYQIEQGVQAFWALGSTGEDISLSRAVRYEYAEKLSNIVGRRVPVIMGSGELSLTDNLEFFKHCFDVGISDVSYIHRDTKQSSSRYERTVEYLANNSPVPIYLYNNVQRGKEIEFQSLCKLRAHPNIKGVKYGARMHMPFIKAASLNSDDFQVMSAGNFFFSALCYGLTASTTSDANYLPKVYTKIKKLFDEGNIGDARKLQQKVIAFLQNIPRTDNGESSAEVKYILRELGLCTEYVNDGYRQLFEAEKDKIRKLVPEIIELNNSCG